MNQVGWALAQQSQSHVPLAGPRPNLPICKRKYPRFNRSSCLVMFTWLFPLAVYAHVISITATTPFPRSVHASSNTTATFTVTNISAAANVYAINQSSFPIGLSIKSSTCGNLLTPGDSCTIQVLLQASVAGHVAGELKIWAQPTVDAVKYPIEVSVLPSLPTITLTPVNSTGLPAVREPVIGYNSGNWLLVSASIGNFHDFNKTYIDQIYVYNPGSGNIHTAPITSLPPEIQNQLNSSDIEFVQDGDTLYLIGGFYTPDNSNWTTLNTITAINVPGMMNAIISGNPNLSPFATFNTTITEFKVTGGQLGKIGNYFYLTFGQDCEGNYCATAQHYTHTIYKFTTDPLLTSVDIVSHVTHVDLDGSGWRRRDYTLSPLIINGQETLFAGAGPFTPGDNAAVWTNGITFDQNIVSNDHFISQQANQYLTSRLSMYSVKNKQNYTATFSGLSNLYWGESGLVYDDTTPYGNVLDIVSVDASSNVQEYANLTPLCSGKPLSSCLYMGLSAYFIPIETYFDSRGILLLDALPQNTPTLVGYIYGGMTSTDQDIFSTPSPSTVTNQVYAVYVTPSTLGEVNWENVTNMFTSF